MHSLTSASVSPLIHREHVRFLWRGTEPVQVVGDFNNWGNGSPPLKMTRRDEDLWSATITVPCDAYLEYVFVRGGERFPDPLNPNYTDNGMGHVNSWFRMPERVETPFAQRRAGVPRGTVIWLQVDTGRLLATPTRTVHLYRPPVNGQVPLLVVLDGNEYMTRAHLPTIVDNLIESGEIAPVAMAFVDNGGLARVEEYACNDRTVAFLLGPLLSSAREHLSLLDTDRAPGAHGILGASMGGLMALYAGVRVPEVFGNVITQSGAFGSIHGYDRNLVAQLESHSTPLPLHIWMDCAVHEWLLRTNRQMRDRLRFRGYDLTYVEHHGGHNYPSWRDVVPDALKRLFPPGSAPG